ncbi:MAG: hypothetical protein AYK18_09605 [Theionarchaea archaeon DG-70]|nr:MAG: hypothetical protein AYK18_09605 [Theionarchaea archaeon DG-70]
MARIPKWRHSKSPYELFQLIVEDPRIPKKEISRKFNVNLKTAEIWWNHAVERRIIIPPIFRRKCYENFKEYFYFLNTDDPYKLYWKMQENKEITYSSVETGFANFFIIAKSPIEPEGDIVLEGNRSDYYVSIPPDHDFQTAIVKMRNKLKDLDSLEYFPSPLLSRNYDYEPWDEKDEAIFQSLCNDMRMPFSRLLKETDTYSDKIMKWFRGRDEFGHTITMFFPEGDSSYILLRYFIDTNNDSLLIDIFSELPTSAVFYRLGEMLVISMYLPFSLEGRMIVREALSTLKSEELVTFYTNSFVEYGYRPD